jgi:hypothetical protein
LLSIGRSHSHVPSQILGGKLNLGAHNGLAAVRACKAKWWVGTHDEVKKGAGIVSVVLRRKAWSVEDALKQAKLTDASDMKYVMLGSGESLVLD